jgi:EAL domain-containing protein (putative c-di-GMP-specific phosphodiesterase class I)
VEDEEVADRLREMGCTHGQGYLWSRPVPAAQAEPLITAPPLTR